ncbi:hypothetical protein B0T25DRAFT_612946 [Lasiosphaeria hispida]|uniref:Uncharacterized protein n=1 Tax=Lasiosphaeria hispida TaxID=260671 RepID=A0AAJ0HBB1_9PEZI|nr:hypothetical protein B0T25DRAFT_612946 [Lasiosphaeria hispida]
MDLPKADVTDEIQARKAQHIVVVVERGSESSVNRPTPLAPSHKGSYSDGDGDSELAEAQAQDLKRRRRPFKLWAFELLCFLLSLASLLVIISVLKSFDGEPLPKLPLHITLNTFLAFFTAFTKAAFMNPVVQCISQWKWNWLFGHDRPLVDFDTFDNASRGVLGSIVLLKLLKWRHIAVVGGVISIIGIATTPVTQLLIEYPSRLTVISPGPGSANATVFAVQGYRSRVGLTGSSSLDIANYISSGLMNSPNLRISDMTPACPSGTCSWEPFESLSLCAKIANITDHIRVRQVPYSTRHVWTTWDDTLDHDPLRLNGTLAYNVSFPDGENFIAPVSYTMYSSALDSSVAFADDHALAAARVAGYKLAWSDAGRDTYGGQNTTTNDPWRWQAFELLYYACVNEYSIRVDNGTARTDIVSSLSNVVAKPGTAAGVKLNCTAPLLVSGAGQSTTCSLDGADIDQGVMTLQGTKGDNFTADMRSLTLLSKYITQDSTGIWAWDGVEHELMAGNIGTRTLANTVYGYMPDDRKRQELIVDETLQLQRLRNMASNLAVSVTNG